MGPVLRQECARVKRKRNMHPKPALTVSTQEFKKVVPSTQTVFTLPEANTGLTQARLSLSFPLSNVDLSMGGLHESQ